jgi:hypothetical protein
LHQINGVRKRILGKDLLEPLNRCDGHTGTRIAEGVQNAGTRPPNLKKKSENHREKIGARVTGKHH